MLTVILSEIAAASIATACCMPARKLAGAAKAAASKTRLMVMPPDVTATKEPGSPCVAADPSWVASDGIAMGAKGFPPPSQDAQGEKVAKISPPMTLKSSSSSQDMALLIIGLILGPPQIGHSYYG